MNWTHSQLSYELMIVTLWRCVLGSVKKFLTGVEGYKDLQINYKRDENKINLKVFIIVFKVPARVQRYKY